MGDDNSGRKWLAIAATAGLTIGAGYVVYKYVLSGDDEEEQKPDIVVKAAVPKPKAGSQFAFPSPPPSVVIKEIKEPKEPKESKDPKSSHSSKNCGKCGKKLTGLPMRCSKCKAAYYCSSNCQKQAWPEHKASCKDGKAAFPVATGTPAPTSTVATVEVEAPIAATVSETEAPIVVTVSETDTAPAPEAEPAITSSADTLQGVLADLLEEQANARNGTIEGDMEKAVLHFVKGDLRPSASAFEQLRVRAAAEDRADIEAESFKWRGLCFSRLKELDTAEKIFRDGVAFCRTFRNKLASSSSSSSNPELAETLLRLQAECQQQLGVALRHARKIALAVDALKDALIMADKTVDDDLKATIICNLGAAMMETSDQIAEGIVCLQTAVQIRADRVNKLLALPEEDAEATRGLLGQAILEHATALVNLAGALFATGKFAQARQAYEQTLAIFEMVGDSDKMCKVLVNLANMAEMQLDLPEEAAKYRKQLLDFLEEAGHDTPPKDCKLCKKALAWTTAAKKEEDKVIVLGCLHGQHDACFQKATKAAEEAGQAPSCPVCQGGVAVLE